MEKNKDLKNLYLKCINGEELTKNECSLIYSLCCCRSTKECPVDVLAAFVFDKEDKPYVSQKEYRALFVLIYDSLYNFERA